MTSIKITQRQGCTWHRPSKIRAGLAAPDLGLTSEAPVQVSFGLKGARLTGGSAGSLVA